MFTQLINRALDHFDCSPWGGAAGRSIVQSRAQDRTLYTPEERVRRDASPWTVVQGVLAPAQFVVFLISLCLVTRYLQTGEGAGAALASVVAKTLFLYVIMVTGSIWERQVFGRYLFAPAFYWEDVVSMLVLALHTTYLVALLSGQVAAPHRAGLALVADASYVVNAAQFIIKLRAARLQSARLRSAGYAAGLGLSA